METDGGGGHGGFIISWPSGRGRSPTWMGHGSAGREVARDAVKSTTAGHSRARAADFDSAPGTALMWTLERPWKLPHGEAKV